MACPDCFRGSIHEGTPRGKISKVHGLDTYISEPPEGQQAKGIIVIIPDAFGLPFINNQLLADHYAEKGNYRVYLPDFMAGWPAPVWMLEPIRVVEGPGRWLATIYNFPILLWALVPFFVVNHIPRSYPRVKKFFTSLRQSEPNLPVFAAGFCWGGKHVLLLGREEAKVNDKPLIDAGFTGHPSLMTLPEDIENLAIPVSFAVGDKDAHIPMSQVEQIKSIVEAKPAGERGEVKIYPNCSHGFCVRVDILFEEVARQAALAEDQCIEWFDGHI
ncbi:alpha/beta-hydrolase [Thozetella sp. PMI_491]|nr:alpha/beta-hydrolase [Thozetella sp. PMI_491]